MRSSTMTSADETCALCKMLLLTVIMLFGHAHAVRVQSMTYKHKDPMTGRELTCNRCPPGFHMQTHCTADQETKCVPCMPNHFTQFWNYLSKCLYCSSCPSDQIVKRECSPLHDVECECKHDFYWNSQFCQKHMECPSGYGVKQKGTAHKNTECEKCPNDSYSNSSSALATCVQHTDCMSHGQQVVLKGTDWHDNLCASCEELETGGAFRLLREILPNFFAHQKIRRKKMSVVVKKLLRGVEKKQLGDVKGPNGSQILQDHITSWIKDASHEMLKNLPETLKKLCLHNIAEKLEKILRKVEGALTMHCNSEMLSN
ncbi:hypothetical protein AGOR_G00039320 [Albula goreensis]|uniref:TNFR-Cys domain-containing protein n=1 Tax=Albula goreensis TaxID=1534307 RepID=A0A8T3DXT1_9TELE|nr:hypothetical protein AGOR_G00039320 [Albula goreensis]